jgi:flagellar biosynthetic protein FliQ
VTDGTVIDIVGQALTVAAKLAGPILGVCLVTGVVIAFLQTITQIQEMTLTFVPKLIGAALVVVVGGHWMLRQVVSWVQELWGMIPGLQ